ncbi:MAG: hypothetical protein Q8Q52_04315 [Acidimicrobiia bacterium]|nr:hypothetical protein [Acidimicrobiia bacterium]
MGENNQFVARDHGRRRWLAATVAIGFTWALAIPAWAGGAADKATGSGFWTNSQGINFYAEFNAHEAKDARPAKGSLFQERVDGAGGFIVDVDSVSIIFETHACFGGITTSAWGTYAFRAGQYRWTTVVDGGEPAIDYLRGGWTGSAEAGATPDWCLAGDIAGNDAWSGGNVQILLGKSYE